LQVAIKYNDVIRKIDEDGPYFGGRYFVGLGSSFHKFPATWQLMAFPDPEDPFTYPAITAWTQEGQSITIDISFYWEFDKANLVDFYYAYGKQDDDYLPIFRSVALESVKRVVSKHLAVDFFDQRHSIAEEILDVLRVEYMNRCYSIVQLMAMGSIDLPDSFENTVIDKVVTAQEVLTEYQIKLINISLAEISVIGGEGDAAVQYKLAKAAAEADLVRANALSLGQQRIRSAEAAYYSSVQTALGMTGGEMLRLRWAKIVQVLEDSVDITNRAVSFAFGYNSPIVGLGY